MEEQGFWGFDSLRRNKIIKMKTQNTLENKTKFFAQYWGQKVYVYDNHSPKTIDSDKYIDNVSPKHYLKLKSLSQISDKDLEKCLNILGQQLDLESFRESFIEGLSNRDFYAQFYPVRAIEIGDYLRSKGYALPYIDLSIEDLISYNWIKL